jgi:hypothetical protein
MIFHLHHVWPHTTCCQQLLWGACVCVRVHEYARAFASVVSALRLHASAWMRWSSWMSWSSTVFMYMNRHRCTGRARQGAHACKERQTDDLHVPTIVIRHPDGAYLLTRWLVKQACLDHKTKPPQQQLARPCYLLVFLELLERFPRFRAQPVQQQRNAAHGMRI